MINSNNEWLTLLSGTIYTIIVLFLYKRQYLKRNINSQMMVILLVTSVFAFYNDYWNYEEQLEMIARSPGLTYGWEQVYLWIAELVGYNYIYWRCIVWGLGVVMIVYILQLYKIQDTQSWLIFYGCYYWLFAYARSAVAMVLFTFGLLLFLSEKKRVNIILGIALMALSVFGHKSLAVALITLPFIFINPNRLFFLISLILFPVVVGILQYLVDNVALFSLSVGNFEYYDIEAFQNDFDRISEYNRFETAGTMRLILGKAVDYSHYLFVFIPTYWICIKKKYENCSLALKGSFIVSYVLFYIGLAFAFCGMSTTVFSYRIINLSILPAIFTILFMLKEKIVEYKKVSFIVFFAIGIEVIEYFLYQFYVNISH